MPFDRWTNPDNATATVIGAIGDSNTWQRSPKERVSRINHRHRLFGSHYQIDGGSKLVGFSLISGKEIPSYETPSEKINIVRAFTNFTAQPP